MTERDLLPNDGGTSGVGAQPPSAMFAARARLPWADLMLFVLPVTAGLGPYALAFSIGPINLYAFRLLVVVAFVSAVVKRRHNLLAPYATGVPFVVLALAWILWGLASVAWAPDHNAAAVEVLAVIFGFATAFGLSGQLAAGALRLRWLRAGWLTAFVVTGTVAVWEVVSGQHLRGSYSDRLGPDALERIFVAATFDNPNNYAAFLLLACPMVLWAVVRARRLHGRAVAVLLAIACIILAILTGGRVGIVGLVVELAGLTVFLVRRPIAMAWTLVLAATAVGVTLLGFRLNNAAAQSVTGIWSIVEEVRYSGSSGIRLNLVRNGLDMIETSWGQGVGAGNFSYYVRHGWDRFGTQGAVNPHNYWLEVGTQYGLFILALLVLVLGWFVVLGLRLLRDTRQSGDESARTAMAVALTLLLGFGLASFENSAYIQQPMNWVGFGSALCLIQSVLWTRSPTAGRAPAGLPEPSRGPD